MAKKIRKRKCKNCHVFFPPDPRNAWHQEYCREPECRKASKAASQKKWLMKEENRDHFRGSENVQRVQEWRRTHPGYWRPKSPKVEVPLQDLLDQKAEQNPPVEPPKTSSPNSALQDLLIAQPLVLIGLIGQLTGSTLQDDIAFAARRLQQLGADILNGPTQNKGGSDDPKVSHLSTAYPKDPQSVQLGGSPSGP
ncbi:MAG: hypothetical protein KGZ83_13340 [Sulfuricella sp.]|nr:hypothetical protein [Sulfuricella sp.]